MSKGDKPRPRASEGVSKGDKPRPRATEGVSNGNKPRPRATDVGRLAGAVRQEQGDGSATTDAPVEGRAPSAPQRGVSSRNAHAVPASRSMAIVHSRTTPTSAGPVKRTLPAASLPSGW